MGRTTAKEVLSTSDKHILPSDARNGKSGLGVVRCHKCGREILARNLRKSGGHILKAKLVFFDEGTSSVMGQCRECKALVQIPIKIDIDALEQKPITESVAS